MINFGFAMSVDISGDYVIVGQNIDPTEFPFAGSAHLYNISNLNAIVEKRLTPTDAPNYSDFGSRVSISGTKALVRSRSDPGPGDPPGAPEDTVWAFDFSDWNNILQSEYGRSTFRPGIHFNFPFGQYLELQEDLAVSGAPSEFDQFKGGVWLHDVSNVLAPQEVLFVPFHSPDDSGFGISLAIDGNTLMVSDRNGHVYLYRLVPEPTCTGLLLGGVAALYGARMRRRCRG